MVTNGWIHHKLFTWTHSPEKLFLVLRTQHGLSHQPCDAICGDEGTWELFSGVTTNPQPFSLQMPTNQQLNMTTTERKKAPQMWHILSQAVQAKGIPNNSCGETHVAINPWPKLPLKNPDAKLATFVASEEWLAEVTVHRWPPSPPTSTRGACQEFLPQCTFYPLTLDCNLFLSSSNCKIQSFNFLSKWLKAAMIILQYSSLPSFDMENGQ